MIILYLGNVGSGKTLSAVMEMVKNRQHVTYYTNINPKNKKKTPWIIPITQEMLVRKEIVKVINKKDGKQEPVYNYKLNEDFWRQKQKEAKTLIIDEMHTLMDARRSQSKVSKIMNDFLALARRVVGDDPQSEGDLILITQLGRRADVIAREMAHQVRYHIMHYVKTCKKCGTSWRETSETPEQLKVCPSCAYWKLEKHSFRIERFHFCNVQSFEMWKNFSMPSYHKHYFVRNVEQYFTFYDTLQWDTLISDL